MTALIRTYESLLLHNLSSARTLESALRNITYLLPGCFEDAEFASEGLYALTNLVSGYHDTLLSKRLGSSLSLPPHPFVPTNNKSGQRPTAPLLPPPSDHARYTRYWTDRSPAYRRASRTLVTLGYVELLVEMASRRRGDRARWRIVLFIEVVKTSLRLLILRVTRRAVLSPPAPQREYDFSSLPTDILDADESTPLGRTGPSQPVIPTLPENASLRSHLYPMAGCLPEDHLPHPLTLVPELTSPSAWASEVLSSTATLLHVILLLRAVRHRASPYRPATLPTLSRSLTPFLLPLLMTVLARHLRPPPANSLLLASHHAQADRQLAKRFFLTGPMWVGWTRPRSMGVIKWVERIPLVGLVGELVEGYVSLVDDYLYCE